VWAPVYDLIAGAAGFDDARRTSIGRLRLTSGARVLIVGAGTGLDLEYLPAGVDVTAVDVTPAMLRRFERRAQAAGRSVTVKLMDARALQFPDAFFQGVVMHLILAVMPQPARGLREVARVLEPGGRIAVFDKFLGNDARPSLRRRLLNALAKPLFSDMNRRLGPLLANTPLSIEYDAPAAFGGMYRVLTLRKAESNSSHASTMRLHDR
jgi:ubiquinone/menaquinone biosynthesis C-methylase UbiE